MQTLAKSANGWIRVSKSGYFASDDRDTYIFLKVKISFSVETIVNVYYQFL